MKLVYCAGPLFNEGERLEMAKIAKVLEKAGFKTFLPQRDGLELARITPLLEKRLGSQTAAADMVECAIFALDVHKLLLSDAVVVNLNGRVPDEGAMIEEALAYAAGLAVVLYKADARSLFGSKDNPMIAGPGDFKYVHRIKDLPAAVRNKLRIPGTPDLAGMKKLGKQIADLREKAANDAELVSGLIATVAPKPKKRP